MPRVNTEIGTHVTHTPRAHLGPYARTNQNQICWTRVIRCQLISCNHRDLSIHVNTKTSIVSTLLGPSNKCVQPKHFQWRTHPWRQVSDDRWTKNFLIKLQKEVKKWDRIEKLTNRIERVEKLEKLKLVLPLNLDQLDLEDQDRVSGNLRRRSGHAVAKVRGNDQLPLLAFAHPATQKMVKNTFLEFFFLKKK